MTEMTGEEEVAETGSAVGQAATEEGITGEQSSTGQPSSGSDHGTPGAPDNGAQLGYWQPEDEGFWKKTGKKIANRNLWISIPNLLLAFAIWLIWSVIVVKIQSLHDLNPDLFAFSGWGNLSPTEYRALLYTLPAVAGLAGATLRIPNSFMIAISGGRNVIAMTTLLLLTPMLLLGIVLQDPDVPFLWLVILAVMTGVGGGAFASSMSNISFFYPKRVQGTSLGLNAGLGNLGVSFMQLMVPIVITFALFGALSGTAHGLDDPFDASEHPLWAGNTTGTFDFTAGTYIIYTTDSSFQLSNISLNLSTISACSSATCELDLVPGQFAVGTFVVDSDGSQDITIPAGSEVYISKKVKDNPSYIQNAGLIWVPLCAIFVVAAWFKMSNLPEHDVGNTLAALGKYFWLETLGFAAAGIGVTLLLIDWGPAFSNPGLKILRIFLTVGVAIGVAMVLLRYLTPKSTKENLLHQWKIFNNKHNWVMTWLYIMTFGSFIGFSAAFPKLILDIFGYLPNGEINPGAPNPLVYAWLGPLVGSLIRPVGGWMSDKWGGAKVTQWTTVGMILATIAVAITIVMAKGSATPETYFIPFLILFMILFITTGIGNGSTFRMVPIIFKREQAGPVLGWISAIAAYGAFIIPAIFGVTLVMGVPEYAMYGFAAYYVSCLGVNWWFYARKGAEMPC